MLHPLDSNFILGNAAAPPDYPIVYCSDGFCALTGEQLGPICQYSRWPLNGRYIAILLPLALGILLIGHMDTHLLLNLVTCVVRTAPS